MKKYYIYKNGQQEGAYSIEELRGLITKDSFVWCEGMEKWDCAENVQDLQNLFKSCPPPFTPSATPLQTAHLENQKPQKKHNGLAIFLGILLVIIVSAGFLYIKDKSDTVDHLKAEASQRRSNEERIKKLYKEREDVINHLYEAYNKLNEAKDFHLLRSKSDKYDQISKANIEVSEWEKKLEKIDNQLRNLGEKI